LEETVADTIENVLEQGSASQGRRTNTRAEGLLEDFVTELGFGGTDALKDMKPHCLLYIVEVILPISWYMAKIKRANHLRIAYILGTAALILLIPLALAYMPQMMSKIAGTGVTSSTIAQLSGVLTGVLALQKMLSVSLAQQQQRYGAWWKVSSDLKKLWYSLQTKWHQAELAANWDKRKDEFVIDVETDIQKARDLVSDEEADFFQKLTLPSVDVLDLLTKTRPDISSMIGALLPGAASANAVAGAVASQATDLLKARQDLAKATTLLASLADEIAKTHNKFATAPVDDQPAIRAALDELLKRQTTALIAKMDAEAAIAAATAH
jgi:hypothetical protein